MPGKLIKGLEIVKNVVASKYATNFYKFIESCLMGKCGYLRHTEDLIPLQTFGIVNMWNMIYIHINMI